MTLREIGQLLSASWLQSHAPETVIEHLLLDTRKVGPVKGTLFFALSGERHDAHQHLPEAYRAGVRHFVVGRVVQPELLPDADVLLVDDTLEALQLLTAAHRALFQYPVVGITGSNGKTIVKEWLYQLLHHDLDIVRSPKSYNSQIGVPLSVWQMESRHQLAIIEAGISHPGEMERLCRIIRPEIGVFTNIGPAHSEGFSSDAEKVAEKMLLFDTAHTLIYCADYPLIHDAALRWQGAAEGRVLLGWTRAHASTTIRYQVEPDDSDGVRITMYRRAESAHHLPGAAGFQLPKSTFHLRFTDAASIENALHCYTFLYWMGVDPDMVAPRFLRLEPVEMRLEIKAAINRCTLVNDAYSNDLASLSIALQFARQQAQHRPLILILSDILQSGIPEAELYGQVAALVREQQVDRLIGIGRQIARVREALPADFPCSIHPDTANFLEHVQDYPFQDALILLKGARVFAFEDIARRLEQKMHKTVLEVNLDALVHNLQVYHRALLPGVKMLVMVKAAGYGAGPAELARLLEFHRVDYLGVAYSDEGIELRQAGVRLPILVLNPEPSGFDALYRFHLEPEVYSLGILNSLLDYARENRPLNIHIKLDTGMHRLGFSEAELPALLEMLTAMPNIRVVSVFSHLAGSDAAVLDGFTRRQAADFSRMYATIADGLGYHPLRHLVNTGGITRFPEYQFDMVRLGIGIYGVDTGGVADQLQVVNTLKATISQIRAVAAGETVGYNRNGLVNRPSRIATISIGYADGFLRLAGNGRYQVAVRGKMAPTIGNICMDMTMIDVSDIPDATEGDEVVIFGADPSVETLASCLQTIPYEVFTNVSDRVKRVYYKG